MENRYRLNRTTVQRLRREHPSGKKRRYWDSEVQGFFLRITPKGSASYCVWIDKKDFVVGSPDYLTPEEARECAREHLRTRAREGLDPAQVRRRKEEAEREAELATFAALAEAFLAAPENAALRPRTIEQQKSNLQRHILPRIGDLALAEISKSTIKQLVREIQREAAMSPRVSAVEDTVPGARTANVCHGIVRRIFNWAMEEDRVNGNPAAFRPLFQESRMKRPLPSDLAVQEVFVALECQAKPSKRGGPMALAALLCFVTLQRPAEVISVRRLDLDFEARIWRIPASRTKTKQVYEVPLSSLAIKLFQQAIEQSDGEWLFPRRDGQGPRDRHDLSQHFGRLVKRLDKAARARGDESASAGMQLYDARRWGRTLLVTRLGVSVDVAERCINHAPDRSISMRYDVGDRSASVRAAMDAWGEFVCGMASEEFSNSEVLSKVA